MPHLLPTATLRRSSIIVTLFISVVCRQTAGAQTEAAYFVTGNASTSTFPIAATGLHSGLVTSASVNYSGLTPVNDARWVFTNPNSSTTLNPASAPYLAYTFNFANATITLDRFVMSALAEFANTTLQLRWSVDGYASNLGQFTINGSNYTLSSVVLSSLGSVTVGGAVTFRVYFYNASGEVFNPVGGTYSALDGTPSSYAVSGQNVSLWYTSVTLPITWLSFSATRQNNQVDLAWSTTSEENSKLFAIQRSSDGVTWTGLGVVSAAGNSATTRNYSYVDQSPVNGINYYRVEEADLDGQTNYSKINTVDIGGSVGSLRLFDNPVLTGSLQFELATPSVVALYDINGRLLFKNQFAAGQGTIDVSHFAAGIYILQSGSRPVKFIIQK